MRAGRRRMTRARGSWTTRFNRRRGSVKLVAQNAQGPFLPRNHLPPTPHHPRPTATPRAFPKACDSRQLSKTKEARDPVDQCPLTHPTETAAAPRRKNLKVQHPKSTKSLHLAWLHPALPQAALKAHEPCPGNAARHPEAPNQEAGLSPWSPRRMQQGALRPRRPPTPRSKHSQKIKSLWHWALKTHPGSGRPPTEGRAPPHTARTRSRMQILWTCPR